MRRIISAFAGLLLAAAPWAAAIEIGDPAPDLTIQEWVKGDPVESFEEGKVYVVEFWATWCPPCRASIPHLTEVQKAYADKGVTIIGISSEEADTVKPFVEEQAGSMDYTVAVDDNRGTSESYMQAFGVGGIPHAFVVDKAGNIAWHGHPMQGLEDVLDQVIEGDFDAGAAEAEQERAARVQALTTVLATLAEEAPEEDLMQAVADRAMKYAEGDAESLARLAFMMLASEDPHEMLVPLAEKAAQQAHDLSKGGDAFALVAMARVHEVKGNSDEALRLFTAAHGAASDQQMKDFLQQRIDELQGEVSAP